MPYHVTSGAITVSSPSGTSVAPGLPGHDAGDLLLAFVVQKPETATVETPSGWTALTAATGVVGTGTQGAGTGQVKISTFYREATASAGDSTLTFTLGGSPDVAAAAVQVFRSGTGQWNTPVGGLGSDTTSATSYSATSSAVLGETTYDLLALATGISADTTVTPGGTTATGATYGTMVERQDAGTASGNDIRLQLVDRVVQSGPATGATTYTATLGAASYGGTAFVRLSEAGTVQKASALVESFDTLGNFHTYDTTNITVVDGNVRIMARSAYYQALHDRHVDLVDSQLVLEFSRDATVSSNEALMLLYDPKNTSGTRLRTVLAGGTLYFQVFENGTRTVSDANTVSTPNGQKFLVKFRQTGTTLTFEQSTDNGSTWTVLYSMTAPSWTGRLWPAISAGTWDSAQTPGASDYATFYNINPVPINLLTYDQATLEGQNAFPYRAVNSTAERSTEWSAEGIKSLRMATTGSNDSFLEVTGFNGAIGSASKLEAGKTYTILGTVRLTAPITGTLNSRRLGLYYFDAGTGGKTAVAPNEAGVHNLALTFTVPSNATSNELRIYHGGTTTGEWVHWDRIGLFKGAVTSEEWEAPEHFAAADSRHGSTVDTASLTHVYSLAPADSTHGSTVDTASVVQPHELAPAGSAHTTTVDTAALTQAHELAPADSAHGSTVDTASLEQAHELAPADSAHGSTVDTAAVVQPHELAPADSRHGSTVDTASLTHVYSLATADLAHAATAEATALLQIHEVAPLDARHAVVMDSSSLLPRYPDEAQLTTIPARWAQLTGRAVAPAALTTRTAAPAALTAKPAMVPTLTRDPLDRSQWR